MTKLLRLLNQIFTNHNNRHDLERFIRKHNPTSVNDVETLTRDYLYNRAALRGARIC